MSDDLHCPGCGYPCHTTLSGACDWCRSNAAALAAKDAEIARLRADLSGRTFSLDEGREWKARAEKAEAENERLTAMPAFVMAARRVGKTAALEAIRREAKAEGEREARADLSRLLTEAVVAALEDAKEAISEAGHSYALEVSDSQVVRTPAFAVGMMTGKPFGQSAPSTPPPS